jgi:rhodanese-related sulfurtransferase
LERKTGEDDMKKQIVMFATLGMCMSAASAAWSYDAKMAENYAKLFAPARGAAVEKELHFVKPENFIKDLQAGKKFVMLDVRTPEETKMFSMSMPDSIVVPTDQVFKPEHLDKIPADKPVMVICKSGARAAAVGTALRSIGFSNVYILKGGLETLSSYYGAKEAYPEPAAPEAKK